MKKIDERYMLGEENGDIYVIADGKRYRLTSHPYEPCLYITDENGVQTVIHNAFNPTDVLECFDDGRTITSISGLEYGERDFCEMVEYAAGNGNIGIETAEEVFRTRAEKNPGESTYTVKKKREEDAFYSLINRYDACVIDYFIVKNGRLSDDYNSHWLALAIACGKLPPDEDGEPIWQFDIGKASAKRTDISELFAPIEKNGRLNYRKAFLEPPHGCGYNEKDFDLVNAALFPCGTDKLDVYEWTTDWSDYFDEGHEWWGALCYTVYDKSMGRFAVILASATD